MIPRNFSSPVPRKTEPTLFIGSLTCCNASNQCEIYFLKPGSYFGPVKVPLLRFLLTIKNTQLKKHIDTNRTGMKERRTVENLYNTDTMENTKVVEISSHLLMRKESFSGIVRC